MTLRDMQYIEVIASEKSITKAAARLYVAQPALSQCVQKVEKELGMQIFNRTSGGVTLTGEGRCFLKFARKTLMEQKNFEKELYDLKNTGGEVLLGFTGTQAAFVLPHFLPRFREKYPNVKITLVEGYSDEIENKLVQGEIEVGIVHPPIEHEELEGFEINHDEMVIIPCENSDFRQYVYRLPDSSVSYIDMEFLQNEPLILTNPRNRSRMNCDEIFARAGIRPKIKQESRNLSVLSAMAQLNYATVLLPSKQIPKELSDREIFYIDPKYSVPFGFRIVTLKDAYISFASRKLIEVFKEIAGTF